MSNSRSSRRDFLQIAATGVAATCLAALLYTFNADKYRFFPEVPPAMNLPECTWDFVRYEPSPWEQEWTANVKEWSDPGTGDMLCQKMLEHEKYVATWETGAGNSQEGCGQLDSRLLEGIGLQVFSRFVYRNSCTGHEASTSIEPLAGLTRHPRAICSDSERKQLTDRGYLILGRTNPNCRTRKAEPASLSMAVPGQRVMLFDMGASLYASGKGGSSQKWFIDMLTKHGVENVEYWGWEATPQDPVKVWSQVPAHLKPQYHWLNIPANPDPASSDNPWNFIKSLAKKTDHVMVKLDIDNSPIEHIFMEQLIADFALQGLIDEMFFEHHVNVEIMYRNWHTQDEHQHLSDTYEMVGGLRKAGMRFHGWP